MGLDIAQKWNAIQTPLATGIVNGLPALEDKFCDWVDGEIHVFKIKSLKPWEPTEDVTESIPLNKRLIIKALALGQEDTLPQAMQDAIAAAEEAQKEAEDPVRALKDVLWELCSYIAENYYNDETPPAFLVPWKSFVDAKMPDGAVFFRDQL